MKLIVALLVFLFILQPLDVRAQPGGAGAATVASCGTPNNTPTVGVVYSITQDTTGKLCTATAVTPSGTQDVNVKQVGATTVLTGAGATGTGSQRTTVAQDATTVAGSAPGTAGTPSANVISVQGVSGGTAQPVTQGTTPWITPFSRSAVVSATFTPQALGYTVGQSVGGAIQIAATSVVPAGTSIRIRSISVSWIPASVSANSTTLTALFFSSALVSTITDGAAPTWSAGDSGKFAFGVLVASETTVTTSNGLFFNNTTQPSLARTMTTDSGGNIDLVMVASATLTYLTPGTATVRVEFEY